MTEDNAAAPVVKTCHRSIGAVQTPCVREQCTMYVRLGDGSFDCLEVRLAASQLNQCAQMHGLLQAQQEQAKAEMMRAINGSRIIQ